MLNFIKNYFNIGKVLHRLIFTLCLTFYLYLSDFCKQFSNVI